MSSKLITRVFGSISTKTGVKPQYKTEAADALNVIAGTNTFLFFLKLLTANDKCSAAVQEFKAIECLTLKYLLQAFSNFPTFGPYPNQEFLNVFLICDNSRLSTVGVDSLTFKFFMVFSYNS